MSSNSATTVDFMDKMEENVVGGVGVSEYVANLLVEKFLEQGLIHSHDKDIYIYSAQILIEKLVGFSVILIISMVKNLWVETILFAVFFSWIRKYTGGFHASNFFWCLIGSCGVYLLYISIVYPIFMWHMDINMLLLCISVCTILAIGAVNHPNMNWNKAEFNAAKKMARIITLLEVGVIIASHYLRVSRSCILFMSFGVILSAALLAFGKLLKQEVNIYGKKD